MILEIIKDPETSIKLWIALSALGILATIFGVLFGLIANVFLKKFDELIQKVEILGTSKATTDLSIENLQDTVGDHEVRIRKIEDKHGK